MALSRFVIFTIALTLPLQLLAQPTLAVRSLTKGTELSFAVTPSSSASNCTYEIFGSQKRKQVSRSTPAENASLISSQIIPDSGTTFLVDGLSKIRQRRNRTRQNIFFRVQETCGETVTLSKVVRRGFRTIKKKKRSINLKAFFTAVRAGLPLSHITLENAFPNVNLTQIVDIRHANDGTNRIFLVQLTGKIYVLENSSDATVSTFLDISDKVQTGGERGMFSIAFHSSFETNRYIYVHYTAVPVDDSTSSDTTIARYTVKESNPNEVDPDSELIIFTTFQPRTNHNGGSILFGSDGYLYITLGDGGGQNDPNGNSQNRGTILGNILRIDVDNPEGDDNYGIPADNPYAGNSDGFLEEIYAYGLRNPWRASFDRETGELYVGDVGQALYEEISIVSKGDNMGWNTMEGFACFESDTCDQTGLTLPIYDYPREDGNSVTGGYVYRGSTIRALTGYYVFGDFSFGTIWFLKKDGETVTVTELVDTEEFIATFGEDEAGELYYADYGGGNIYRFTYRPIS